MSRLRRQTGTIRFRITALAAVVVLIVLAAAGAGLVMTQRQLLLRDLDSTLRQRADDLAALAAAGRLPVQLGGNDDDTAAQVVTLDGEVVAASPNLAGTAAPIAGGPPAGGRHDTVRTVRGLPVDDDPFRLLSRLVDTAEGPLVVHVAGGTDDIGESTGALRTSLSAAVPAVAALLALVVWWLVGRTLRPVEAIRAEVHGIGGSDRGHRVPEPRGDDEIARLARTMNRMLERLEGAAERQQRFVADASHELRSPLTRIRAEVEVDLAHPGGADPLATHRSVLEETVALQGLVDDLLALARGDAGGTAPDDLVDLDDLVVEQARRARAGGRVAVDGVGVRAARVRGDRGGLERAVANLVDNAARYASSAVTLTLEEAGGRVALTVADDGPGIPHDQHERVFERFARADESRRGGTGGTGLGLAIARDVARRHGGDIAVDPAHAPGARLVMTLPAARPPVAGKPP